jgi:hypothetical protein
MAVGLLTVLGGGNAFGLSFVGVSFDQNITPDAIFGDGNDNGSWNVGQSNGIELGLRGKLRYPAENTFNSNGDGTYSFNAGTPIGAPAGNGEWAFEWSINTDYDEDNPSGYLLDSLVYQIRIDYDPGIGTNYQTFDLINDGSYWDHSIGDNSTGNGAGIEAITEAEYATYISTYNVAQNSWRMTFFDDATHVFDPDVDGTYDFELIAYDPDDLDNPLASTSMQIIVGAGAPVPEPASIALLGIGIAGLAGARLRKRRS